MKIAILKGSLCAEGGLEKYCQKIAERLAADGHEVHILGFGTSKPLPHSSKISIHALVPKVPLSLLQLLLFDRAAKKWLQQNPCDKILGFFRNTCLQTEYRAGNGCHKAYLEHRKKECHKKWCGPFKALSFLLNPLHRFILHCEKATFESPNLQHLIVNSQLVANEIAHYYPNMIWTKVYVVHNGVEWSATTKRFYQLFEERERSIKSLALKELSLNKSLKLLFVGHEWRRKGLYLLLEALAQHPQADWELMVVGKERHPEQFKSHAKHLGIENKIHWYGPQRDLSHFYTVADVVVIPSLYDPFANVTVEALNYGCLVVSSTTNGGCEVLIEEVTGYTFDIGSERLSWILEELLSYRKTLASAEAIRSSISHLDFDNQLAKCVNLIYTP